MVRALDFNPNKPNQIASAGDDCKVRFWDLRNTTESIKEISDHTHWYLKSDHSKHGFIMICLNINSSII